MKLHYINSAAYDSWKLGNGFEPESLVECNHCEALFHESDLTEAMIGKYSGYYCKHCLEALDDLITKEGE